MLLFASVTTNCYGSVVKRNKTFSAAVSISFRFLWSSWGYYSGKQCHVISCRTAESDAASS